MWVQLALISLFLAYGGAQNASSPSNESLSVFCDSSSDTNLTLSNVPNDFTFRIYSNYPGVNHQNNQSCQIRFTTGAYPVYLDVKLVRFHLEGVSGCAYDWLCLKGIKFCGYWPNNHIIAYAIPANSSFTIKFSTDSSVTKSGFQIDVTPTTVDYDNSLYEPYGIYYATSPAAITTYHLVDASNYEDICSSPEFDNNTYNENYTYNMNNIYKDNYTYNDKYTYIDNYTNNGNSTNRPSDESAQIIQCPESSASVTYYLESWTSINSTNQTFNNQFVLRSPKFGQDYYINNVDCTVKFVTSSKRQKLNVFFSKFDIERTDYCVFDWMCLKGVKFCGNWATGVDLYYDIPANSTFTVSFHTDGSVTREGFQAVFTFRDLQEGEVVQEIIGGYGSGVTNYIVSNSTTNPYEDNRCAGATNSNIWG